MYKNRLSSFKNSFNLSFLIICQACFIPIHFTGVKNCISSFADINECCFHGRKYILNFAKVNVSDIRNIAIAIHIMFYKYVIFQNSNLCAITLLAYQHLSVYRFASR